MKKKILFITNAFTCGGIENALYDLIQSLNRDIFDITIFALYKGQVWDEKFINTGVRIVFATPVLRNPYNPFERIKIHNDYKRLAVSRKNQGDKLLDIFFKESFDLIICYHGYSDVAACFSLGGKAKTIEYVHCAVDTNLAIRKQVLENAKAIRKCDRLVCVSKIAKEQIDVLLGVEKKSIVAHNTICYDRVKRMSLEKDIEICAPYICAIGNFGKGKGFPMLVNIMGELYRNGISTKLVIIGDGPDMENVKKAIHENQLEESVILTGYRANPYPILKNAQYMVISSFNEGMPVVAMESLCLGVPVISAYPSVCELFGEEKCGVISESTEEGLYTTLKSVLHDEVLYSQLRQGAQRRSEYYKNGGDLKRIEQVYLDLIEEESTAD